MFFIHEFSRKTLIYLQIFKRRLYLSSAKGDDASISCDDMKVLPTAGISPINISAYIYPICTKFCSHLESCKMTLLANFQMI